MSTDAFLLELDNSESSKILFQIGDVFEFSLLLDIHLPAHVMTTVNFPS